MYETLVHTKAPKLTHVRQANVNVILGDSFLEQL